MANDKGWVMMTNEDGQEFNGNYYADVHNNSGVWTIGTNGLFAGAPSNPCSPYVEYTVGAKIKEDTQRFSPFVGDFGEITNVRSNTSCNEEMLVMWFNNNGRGGLYNNFSYDCILEDNHIFDIKNVDECTHLIYCQSGNDNTFRASNAYQGSSTDQKFQTNQYKDSGFPYISKAPCIGAISDYTQKYVSGTPYDGHKIKYRPTQDKIPDGFYDGVHEELVELYFPHMYVDGDGGVNTKVIGQQAFQSCKRLSAVTFSSVSAISGYAFAECGLKNIDWGHHLSNGEECCKSDMKIIGKGAFMRNRYLNYINLPEGLQEIGQDAFLGCAQDAASPCRIYIPSSVTKIDGNAFNGIVNSHGDTKIRWDIDKNSSGTFSTGIFAGTKMHVYLPNITCDEIGTIKTCFANYDDSNYVEFYIKSSSNNTCIGGNVHLLSDWNWPTDFPFDNPSS